MSTRLLSIFLIFFLLVGTLGSGITAIRPVQVVSAQEDDDAAGGSGKPLEATLTYTYNPTFSDSRQTRTILEKFTGSASLYTVEGGFEGNNTGSYQYSEDVIETYPGCDSTIEYHTTTHGRPDMVVHYQYSIDNSITGGPDTSMYNSSYGVVEVLIDSRILDWQDSGKTCEGDSYSDSGQDGSVGFGCFFYDLDFDKGGTFRSINEVTSDPPSSGTCTLTLTGHTDKLRIFGTVKGLFGTKGNEGLSNSRVLLARLDEDYIERLSVSKPNFMKKTDTSDDKQAKYEFTFERGPGKLPKMMVVSLLWHDGSPEFAITNGREAAGRLIPVYQALCVDDIDGTECEKWQSTGDGSFEAEVNFEFGSEDKLLQTLEFMELEDWMGTNTLPTGTAGGTSILSGTGVTNVMADSAYMYYNSFRAMKYFETLGLQSTYKPLVIKSHDFDPSCSDAGAWYYDKANSAFGDLGSFTDKVVATGGEITMCDVDDNSDLNYFLAPKLPLWHEIGHYLHFQMYDPNGTLRGTNHQGYRNPSTNDSFIEGFAGFVAILIDEYYGSRTPYEYNGENVELDLKIWGPMGTDEEEAIAGILWDFHDGGREINLSYDLNGTSTQVSRVYPASMDDVSLGAPIIMKVIDRNEVKTLVDLYNSFVSTQISAVNLNMIYVNHGVFADVENRNYVHDSTREKIGESGSKSSPLRPVRSTPPPQIPGSYIVSSVDSTYNITITFQNLSDYYDYSYLRNLKADEPMYFKMPPEYYPSTATLTPLSKDGEPLSGAIEIDSDNYWNYIRSNPPQDGVFKRVSVNGGTNGEGTVTALQYIQNAKDLLSRVSIEYKAGNGTGAEELAVEAYLANFKYVEDDLVYRNATVLKAETETMLRDELVALIQGGASSQIVDAKISDINAKLDEAVTIVPEFPVIVILLVIAISGIVVYTRLARNRVRLW